MVDFNLQNVGRAFQGFGEGVQGRGQQFLQGLETQRQTLSDDRRRNLLLDNRVLLDNLKAGNVGAGINLLRGRMDRINQLGGDPSDTLDMLSLLETGTPESLKLALSESQVLDREAVLRGELKELATQQDKFIETRDGQAIVRTPSGAFEARTIKDIAAQTGRKPEDLQKQVNTLRKSINDAEKDFSKVDAANNRIKRTGRKATPASDISLIFNFMKMNDPGSTVREGEFATAQNATGVPDQILNAYNKALTGQRLSSDQREDFIGQSEGLFAAQREAFDTKIGSMLQQADVDQIPRVRVLGEKRLSDFVARTEARGAGVQPAPQNGEISPLAEELTNDQLLEAIRRAQGTP